MSARVISSSAANGSSISRIGAPSANPRTSETRCCMPPESSWGYDVRKSASPTVSIRSSMSRSDSDARVAATARIERREEADVALDGRPRHQRRRLGHETVLLGLAGDRGLLSGHLDDAAVGLDEPTDHTEQRRLSRSPTDRAGSRIRLVGRRGRPTAAPRRPVDGGGRPCGRPASTRGGRRAAR